MHETIKNTGLNLYFTGQRNHETEKYERNEKKHLKQNGDFTLGYPEQRYNTRSRNKNLILFDNLQYMTRKWVFVSFVENFWWRHHEKNEKDNIIYPYQVINNWKSVEVKSIYPTDDEAMKALNTLIWYCVWKWMKLWDYKDSEDLCMNMIPWVELLRAKAFNPNL